MRWLAAAASVRGASRQLALAYAQAAAACGHASVWTCEPCVPASRRLLRLPRTTENMVPRPDVSCPCVTCSTRASVDGEEAGAAASPVAPLASPSVAAAALSAPATASSAAHASSARSSAARLAMARTDAWVVWRLIVNPVSPTATDCNRRRAVSGSSPRVDSAQRGAQASAVHLRPPSTRRDELGGVASGQRCVPRGGHARRRHACSPCKRVFQQRRAGGGSGSRRQRVGRAPQRAAWPVVAGARLRAMQRRFPRSAPRWRPWPVRAD
jgi:hypothetical protein